MIMSYGRTDWRNEMYIISAVIENERAKVALYDKEYKLLAKKEGMKNDAVKLCTDIIFESGIKNSDVDYIGVVADSFDSVAADLEKDLGIKCLGASFISARALGEAYMTNDVPFLVMLKVDETIECGIVIDKNIYSGVRGQGVNVADMVVDFGGYECSCGRRGCFKAYSSNSGLKRIAAESGVANAEQLTHKELFAMNTPEAEHAKQLYVAYLASGITNIINLFQPNEMVLEGPFTEVGDELMAPMTEAILREQYTHSMPHKCNVRFSNKEADTALLGGALLGR